MKGSPSFNLSAEDVYKVVKGAGIAAAGCAIAYLVDAIPGLELGIYSPLGVAASAVLANLAAKWGFDTTK